MSYNAKVRRLQGGKEIVVADGGVLRVETNGSVVASGMFIGSNGLQNNSIASVNSDLVFGTSYSSSQMNTVVSAIVNRISLIITALENVGMVSRV